MWRLVAGLTLLAACSGGGARDAGTVNVLQRDDPSAAWSCAKPEACTSDYLAFPAAASDHAAPVGEAELARRLADIDAGVVALTSGLDAGELGARVVDGLGVGFLRDGLDARPLEVVVTSRTDSDTWHQERLLFVDPFVGTFEAVLLEPRSGGPFPAVLALHGHGGDAASYRDTWGFPFPDHGYALLVPTLRAMNIDADEHQVSDALMRSGFTLMGLRAYEAMLALKYLRWRPGIIHDRLGLIGHSGGSSTGNLLVRFEPAIRVYVSDHTVDWFSSGVGEPWHCETVPALYPLHEAINDFTTSSTPIRKVTYGYPEGFVGIFAFLDRALKPR